jgi:FtsH-binding integral membrane protein
MTFAIISFIFFFLCTIFFITAGYTAYKKKNDIDELFAGMYFALWALFGCLIVGIRITMGE